MPRTALVQRTSITRDLGTATNNYQDAQPGASNISFTSKRKSSNTSQQTIRPLVPSKDYKLVPSHQMPLLVTSA